jgi:hypothetical protein
LAEISQGLQANQYRLLKIATDTARIRETVHVPQSALNLKRSVADAFGGDVSVMNDAEFSFNVPAETAFPKREQWPKKLSKASGDLFKGKSIEKSDVKVKAKPEKNWCLHKPKVDCQLSNPKCCACLDARPHQGVDGYETYVDGSGIGRGAKRWAHYCPNCRSEYNR